MEGKYMYIIAREKQSRKTMKGEWMSKNSGMQNSKREKSQSTLCENPFVSPWRWVQSAA